MLEGEIFLAITENLYVKSPMLCDRETVVGKSLMLCDRETVVGKSPMMCDRETVVGKVDKKNHKPYNIVNVTYSYSKLNKQNMK